MGSSPSIVKNNYNKNRKKIIKLIPELTNHGTSSTQMLSFNFDSSATTNTVPIFKLKDKKDKKMINSATFKKSNLNSSSITRELYTITTATQTDPILNNSIDYNELKINYFFSTNDEKDDRPEISVTTRKKIVKPPRAHPPISRPNKSLNANDINISKNKIENSLSKKNNSLYPEIHVINYNDSKSSPSFPSISSIDENSNYYQQQYLISSSKKKINYSEKILKSSNKTFNKNLIIKKSTTLSKSFIKKFRRILNLNNNNSKSKSKSSKSKSTDMIDTINTSKSSFSITSALASLPVGHSTFMDINMSQVLAAGGQDKEETKNPQRYNIINKKIFKVYTKNNHHLINYPHSEQSVIDKKNVIIEINSQNSPECRIIDINNDDENILNLSQDDNNNNNNNNESSCISGFTKDFHQIFKDVKSYFRISNSYNNLNKKSNWTINMSTLKKSTSLTLLKKKLYKY